MASRSIRPATYLSLLDQHPPFRELAETLRHVPPEPLRVEGLLPCSTGFFLAALQHALPDRLLWVLLETPRLRERLANDLHFWQVSHWLMPEDSLESDSSLLGDPEVQSQRLQQLQQIQQASQGVILLSPTSLASAVPAQRELELSGCELVETMALEQDAFIARLAETGFEHVPLVYRRGQFASRGGIVDVFDWQSPLPLRLEFFDDTLESLRHFDPDSQLSDGKCTAAKLVLSEPRASAVLNDYLQPEHRVIGIGAVSSPLATVQLCISSEIGDEADCSLQTHPHPLGHFEAGDFVVQEAKRQLFFQQLQEWREQKWQVLIIFANRGEEVRFRELVGELEGVVFLHGNLVAGFLLPALRLAVISSAELFGRYRQVSSNPENLLLRHQAAITSLDDIELDDLVVHLEYGIGRFRGIHLNHDDQCEEVCIEYRDGALLSVPIEQVHLIAKYVGMGGKTPELNKLGGTGWKNTRRSAETAIKDYAAQILKIQAERATLPAEPHAPDNRWMWEFEQSFHYTETADQLRAIEETKRDMELPRPMDRLICGDVGFGKTEVAIRAAFKAVTGGRQVAILVPTTVLAEQHWRTFRERMSDYPIRIELLSRFRSAAEARQTVAGLADGGVDIVIGTHRLLSNDITYQRLGLIVIDEEQRFGVKHKERFKERFRGIDVLTLSATPIPRTLYMALMGTRDMSTIDTPPPNRSPVHTTISTYDERVIRDAILREMQRGGQVFFLHNRVKTIAMMQHKLQQLVPQARIVIGHGQMDQDELEVVMNTFVRGEADVLLATTIIETGIDIPNANTILIDRADRFGLADLYQLRGRVGRAGEKAYAILLLPRAMMAQSTAGKRIAAIKQYTALGSGFKIAMRDLEIRGAGNLLGTKQSGHIAAVGFDLYCQLLRRTVDQMRGQAPPARTETLMRLDFLVLNEAQWQPDLAKSALPAFLPKNFISDTRLRVAAFRSLAECRALADVTTLEQQWRDRFGRLPVAVQHLLHYTRLRLRAADLNISLVEVKQQRLTLVRNGSPLLIEQKLPRLKSQDPAAKLEEIDNLLQLFQRELHASPMSTKSKRRDSC